MRNFMYLIFSKITKILKKKYKRTKLKKHNIEKN